GREEVRGVFDRRVRRLRLERVLDDAHARVELRLEPAQVLLQRERVEEVALHEEVLEQRVGDRRARVADLADVHPRAVRVPEAVVEGDARRAGPRRDLADLRGRRAAGVHVDLDDVVRREAARGRQRERLRADVVRLARRRRAAGPGGDRQLRPGLPGDGGLLAAEGLDLAPDDAGLEGRVRVGQVRRVIADLRPVAVRHLARGDRGGERRAARARIGVRGDAEAEELAALAAVLPVGAGQERHRVGGEGGPADGARELELAVQREDLEVPLLHHDLRVVQAGVVVERRGRDRDEGRRRRLDVEADLLRDADRADRAAALKTEGYYSPPLAAAPRLRRGVAAASSGSLSG